MSYIICLTYPTDNFSIPIYTHYTIRQDRFQRKTVRGGWMDKYSTTATLATLCFLTFFVGSASAGPTPVQVPEPTGITAFLGAAVAGVAAIRHRLKK
jgi:hypothetical protein